MLNTSELTTRIPETARNGTGDSTAEIERLRQIGVRHQVCYEVCREWSVAEGRKIPIGFELELCGVNNHMLRNGESHPIPGCSHCLRTYDAMRQIAEWILPREERPSRCEIQAFDRALHIAPAQRRRRSEVVVTIVIMHRGNFNRPVDDCENRCLKEMHERLSQLGIREGVWRAEDGLRKE